MTKKLYKLTSFFIAIVFLIMSLLSYTKSVNAEVPANQIVTKNASTWGTFDFTVKTDFYYIIQDPYGLTTCTYSNPTYYFTENGTTFKSTDGKKGFVSILNKVCGIILDPSEVDSWYSTFCAKIGLLDTINNKYAKNGLYDTQDNFYGYCINDISETYYDGLSANGLTTSKDYSDNIINFYNYQKAQGDLPPFVTYYSYSKQYISNNYHKTNLSSNQITFLESVISDSSFGDNLFKYAYQGQEYLQFTDNNPQNCGIYEDVAYAVMKTPNNPANLNSDWNNWINAMSVDNDYCILSAELPDIPTTFVNQSFILYDSSDNVINSRKRASLYDLTITDETFDYVFFGSINNTFWHYRLLWGKDLTIYKDLSSKESIENKTYYPTSYVTDSYNDYSSSSATQFVLTQNQVDNSITYNGDIYDNANQNYYDYYDNGYYDQSSNITNVTNITNNYYDGSGGGDNPDNPNNPDNPDNPDNNTTLDAILEAILRFFKAIGDIIGTVLAGILNMIDAVLEAIAGITEDLTGISDFFSAMLGWLPEPIPTVIGIGISLCIIAGIIKFIRG